MDEYSNKAIGLEGSKNWPSQWDGEKDPVYKEYMEALRNGTHPDADKFIDRALGKRHQSRRMRKRHSGKRRKRRNSNRYSRRWRKR